MARLSPWVLAGIGCLGVAALGVVAIGGVGFMVSKTMREELKKPVDKEALLTALKLPIHPKARFNEELTRGMRAGTVMATKFTMMELTMAAFSVDAPLAEVKDWYKKTLSEKGYTLKSETQEKTQKLSFEQGEYLVTVDLIEPSSLMLMRLKVPQNQKK